MNVVESILNISKVIYDQCEKINHCKHQKRRLMDRMDMLLPSIRILLEDQPPEGHSSDLQRMLKRMLDLLEEAEKLLEKYISQNWMERLVKAGPMLDRFKSINSHLGDVGNGLSLLLQVEARVQARFEKCVLVQEDSRDLAEDKVSLSEMLKGQKAGITMNITEIKKDKLTIGSCMLNCESFELYKGEFCKSPVAIKVFKSLLNNNPQDVRAVFVREVRTMKMFESPYILRLYGICIEENVPQYSLVMEYCEKGNLRQVLKKEPNLPWHIRTEMASDAAAGLFRLHQSGEKTHMHCCIDSTKFLVGKGYSVKLFGFELSQTMSSLRRKPKNKSQKEVLASAYICPEGLKSMDHEYTLASEIYSFGIVLWEIATCQLPFAGCTENDIYEKVVVKKEQEHLGEDCPPVLRDIIHQCRDFNPSKRPSVEAIVNKLLTYYPSQE